MLYTVLRNLSLWLLRVVFRFRAVGLENVPAEGPVLLAANHLSFLDPPVVGAAVGRPLHFMAKAELFHIPLVGTLIRKLNAHPVDRSGSDAAALRMALGLLRDRHALLVFPEGTRSTEQGLGPGKAGVGMLAAVAEAPVVPVYIEGTGRALPRGAAFPRPTRITVAYGSPLRFEKGRGKARYQAISDEIMAAISRLKAENDRDATRTAVPSAARDETDLTARRASPAGRIH